jgi:hypothetical protein
MEDVELIGYLVNAVEISVFCWVHGDNSSFGRLMATVSR